MKRSDLKLAELELFSGVAADDLAPMADRIRLRDYRDEETIFLRGEVGEAAFIVVAGMVRISSLGASGKRIMVEIFKPKDMFGELSVLDQRARTADANALGATCVAIVPSSAIHELLLKSPVFSLNLLKLVTTRLRRTYSLLEDASLTDLEHRLAKQVMYLVGLGATNGRQARLYSRLRQGDLADLLGATPRSIIKILNKWRALDLAEFDGRTAQLTILDMERFTALADEEPAAESALD